MKTKLGSILKVPALQFCVFFTATTLVDNVWQLSRGQLADSNYHIINRAVIILIAVISMTLFDTFRFGNKIVSHAISYAISMALVFVYVWFTSFFDPLSPGAYGGIFVTFTSLTALYVLITEIKKRR